MKIIPLIFCLLAQICTAATAATCAGGIFGSVASLLSGFGPAYTYCSAKYPLPLVTTTLTAPTSTIRTTIATTTITLTVSTATTTVTAAPVTSSTTTTIIQTQTTMTTVTVTAQPNKRNLIPRASTTLKASTTKAAVPNGQSSLWSSLTATNPAFVGPVCTCLEVRQTTTVTTTPKTTTSITATSTSSVTTTTTATVTPTITTTATTSSTTTVTVTTTTTTTSGPPPCTALPDPYNAPNGKSFDLDCTGGWSGNSNSDYVISASDTINNFQSCLDYCSPYSDLKYVDFFTFGYCACLRDATDFVQANGVVSGKVIVPVSP